jgi:hypothetical protein
MEHIVTTKEGKVSLTSRQLLETLFLKIKNTDKPELVKLANALAEYIGEQKLYPNLTAVNLLVIGIGVGYFYRIFRSNNDVQVSIDAASINQSNDKSNGIA